MYFDVIPQIPPKMQRKSETFHPKGLKPQNHVSEAIVVLFVNYYEIKSGQISFSCNPHPCRPYKGKIANRQSLAILDRRLSFAILTYRTVELRIANRAFRIAIQIARVFGATNRAFLNR